MAAADMAAAVELPAGAIAGTGALALHVRVMRQALRSGLRRQLGRPFVQVHVGWAGLGASLVAGLALVLQWPAAAFERAPALFGALLVLSLLTFLLGMMARIVPFLASMHAPAGRRGPPLPSALAAERPLALFFHCHLVAVAALLTAVLFDSAWLVRAAALAGSVGALLNPTAKRRCGPWPRHRLLAAASPENAEQGARHQGSGRGALLHLGL